MNEKKEKFHDWNEDKHRAYADKNLKGCTHFGFNPKDLKRSSIRFDTFHLSASTTRKLGSYLRDFIFKQTIPVQVMFNDVISSFWGEFKCTHWLLNRPLAKFKGPELLEFVKNIPKVNTFLTTHLGHSEEARWIVEGLGAWHEISPFLVIAHIEDKLLYIGKMYKFELDVRKFYKAGANTFLSKKYVGDEENFYCHCLRLYMPVFARKTFEIHGTGIGIFTMQGFEHRNKESKRVFNTHTNKKGNVSLQVMARLWDIFETWSR